MTHHNTGPEGLHIELLLPGRDLEAAGDDVWHILQSVDKEFFPPLSARSDTTEHDLTKEAIWGGPISFFDTVMKEAVLMAYLDGKAVGLLSFIPHYSEEMLQPWSPSTYASTAAVLPRHRRRGIGTALNDQLERLPEELTSPFITRRTWSTNTANLKLLAARGFEEVIRMVDHRGPGIDTIYLARRTETGEPL
jgi:ribosomal protein S18 acetylase RimI-like enzyme